MKSGFVFTAILLITGTAGVLAREKKPAYSRLFLEDIASGNRVFLKHLIGEEPVILNFWATYCVPCAQEMPELQKLIKKFPGLKLIFVNIDEAKNLELVKKRVTEWGVTETVLLDKFQIAVKRYTPGMAVPSTFLIKDGNIVYTSNGYNEKTMGNLEEAIKRVIKPGS